MNVLVKYDSNPYDINLGANTPTPPKKKYNPLNYQFSPNRITPPVYEIVENNGNPFADPFFASRFSSTAPTPEAAFTPKAALTPKTETPVSRLITPPFFSKRKKSPLSYREEIPFERFVADYQNELHPKSSSTAFWKARVVALMHVMETALQIVAHTIIGLAKYGLERKFDKDFDVSSRRHKEVLNLQISSLAYSLFALWNPLKAINSAKENDKVGIDELNRNWGSFYDNRRTFLFWGNYGKKVYF